MPLAFSPDSTKLVAGTTQRTALVWDLRRIRDQLVSRGLDWDALPYPRPAQRKPLPALFPLRRNAGHRRDRRNGVDCRPPGEAEAVLTGPGGDLPADVFAPR